MLVNEDCLVNDGSKSGIKKAFEPSKSDINWEKDCYFGKYFSKHMAFANF